MLSEIARKIHGKIKNKSLLRAVNDSKDNGQMTDELVGLFSKMVRKMAMNWRYKHLTYNEDMQAYAMMMLCRTWHKFDTTKLDEPFGYYTVCIKSAFIQYLAREKRQEDIKEDLQNMVDDEQHF